MTDWSLRSTKLTPTGKWWGSRMLQALAEKELAANKVVKEAFGPVSLHRFSVTPFSSWNSYHSHLLILSFLFYNKTPFHSSKENTV